MTKKSEFHSVEFFRTVRDRQAAELAEKTPEQIMEFFVHARERLTSAPSRRHIKRSGASR